MENDLGESRESVALLYVGVLGNDYLTVDPCGIGYRSGTLHVVKIACELPDLLVDSVILLCNIDHVAVVLPVKDEKTLRVLREILELPAVGVEGDLVEQNKTVACVVLTEIGEIDPVTPFYVVVAEDALVFAFAFGDPL